MPYTKTPADVYAPVDSEGRPRGAAMGDALVLAEEMVREIDGKAEGVDLSAEASARQAGDAAEAQARQAAVAVISDRIDQEVADLEQQIGSAMAGLNWINAGWQTATDYAESDALSHNGTSYRCIAAHTSGAASEPGVGANWADYWVELLVIDRATISEALAGFDAYKTMTPEAAAAQVRDLSRSRDLEVEYTGSASITPIIVGLRDGVGYLILGYDRIANALVGSLASGGGSTASPAPGMIGYVDGDELRAVGAEDVVAALLGDYEAIAVSPGTDRSVRAVLNWPMLGPTRSVSAANGLLIPDAVRILHIIIGIGQSLEVGSQSASTLISITPLWPEDALMFDRADGLADVRMGLITSDGDGAPTLNPADLSGFTPLVAKVGQGSGARGETPMEALAFNLAQAARDIGIRFRTLSFTAAMGGTGYSGLKKGTQIYDNMLAAVARAKVLAEAQGWKVVVDACQVKHGEGDSNNTSYLANLLEWQSDIDTDVKAITGQANDVHFLIGQPSSMIEGSGDRFAAVKAMLAAHNTSPVHHLSGPDYPYGDAYASDNLHFTGPGYHWIADQFTRAYKQVLWATEEKSTIVQITAAVRVGTTVTLTYEVPEPPLVFDTTTVTERDVKGFRFFDSSGEITISSATITGPAEITLTLASTPNGSSERVTYAMREQSNPRTAGNRPRGNVRDSATMVSRYAARQIYNWAVHQQFDL